LNLAKAGDLKMILILKNSKKVILFSINALLILNLLMPATALAKGKKKSFP